MKKLSVLAAAAAGLLISTLSVAATAKTYQVTGPVLEVNGDMIVVQKGKDRWEIARDGSTKMGDVKVGDKVTVEYRMHAMAVEVKSSAKPAKTKKAA
jgi:hypothetical protein